MYRSTRDQTAPVSAPQPRRRAGLLLLVLAFAAVGLGACQAGASTLPSVSLPTVVVPTTNPSGSPIAACVNAPTMAVLTQLKAPGADITGLLTSNKDALIAGLSSLQPADEATKTWREALVKALQDGDMTTASAKMNELVSGGVTLTAC